MATPADGKRSMILDRVAVHENRVGGLVIESTDPDATFILYVPKRVSAYQVLHDLLVWNGRVTT